MKRYVPKRGDLIWLNFNPQAGSEQADHRPAFVVSPEAYNRKVGLVLVCPVRSCIKGYPFEVNIPDGLSVQGVVLTDQLISLDWVSKRAEFICDSPIETVEEVLGKIAVLIQ